MISDKKTETDQVLNNISTKKNYRSSLRKLNSLKEFSEEINYRYDDVLYNLAVCLNRLGEADKSLINIEKCVEIREKMKEEQEYAKALSYYSVVLVNTGDYEKAFEVLNKALKIQSKSENSSALIETYLRLGNIYRVFLDKTDTCIAMCNKALNLSLKLNDFENIAACYGSLGNSYLYLHKNLLAKNNYEKAMQLFEKAGRSRETCMALLGLATAERALGNVSDSIYCLTRSLSINKRLKNLSIETSASLNLAVSYLAADDKKNADHFYKRSVSLIKKIDSKDLRSTLYLSFAEVYESKKDFENAYRHHVLYHNLYSETFKAESERLTKMLKLKYEKEKADNKVEIYMLKNRELKSEVESKQRELNSMASYLSQKNEFINKLVKNVKKGFSELKIEDTLGRFVTTIIKDTESAVNINEDLKRFETELENFSFGFVEKLSKKFPGLSRVELKICSMIKINLSAQEIASILYISKRTVEAHKYNISRKLRVKPRQNLISFFNSL